VIIPPGFAEVAARITLAGDAQTMNIVFGIEVEVPPFTQDLANLVSLHTADFIRSLTTTVYTYQGVDIAVGNDGAPTIFSSVTSAGVGEQAGSVLPQNSALLVHKRTARAGRRGRGRIYLPGIQENQVDNVGGVATAWITAANTEGANWLSDLDGAGARMVLLHDTSTAVPPSAVPLPDVVTSLTTDPIIATQRRRLRS
jgi:hypothetical protein